MRIVVSLLFSSLLPVFAAGTETPSGPDEAEAAYGQGMVMLSGGKANEGNPDPVSARRAFEEAAAKGHAGAAVQLGILFAEGKGAPKDDALALKYFSEGAAKGQREGLYNQGLFLLQGRGAPRNLELALSSLDAAAKAGSIPAHVKLADLFYFGTDGLAKDHARALPHVKAAAVAGDAWACNILGTMAELGQGMERDRSTAIYWFKVAAEQGHAKAQGNLGRLLRAGKPTDWEKLESYKWLKLSSEQGISMSTYQLNAQSRTMTPAQIAEAEGEVLKFKASREGNAAIPLSPPADVGP